MCVTWDYNFTNQYSTTHMSITVTVFASIILDIWLKDARHIHC